MEPVPRKPFKHRVLIGMLLLGGACITAGWIAFRKANQPYLQGQTIFEVRMTLIPSEDRFRPKTSLTVCPKAFIHGTKYDLSVYVAQTAELIGQVGYLPVSARILTRASVVYEAPWKEAPVRHRCSGSRPLCRRISDGQPSRTCLVSTAFLRDCSIARRRAETGNGIAPGCFTLACCSRSASPSGDSAVCSLFRSRHSAEFCRSKNRGVAAALS